jgi:transaldolase
MHVVDSARLGADIATMPYAVMEKLAKHPLTDLGLARFLADWEKVPKPALAAAPRAKVAPVRPKGR